MVISIPVKRQTDCIRKTQHLIRKSGEATQKNV